MTFEHPLDPNLNFGGIPKPSNPLTALSKATANLSTAAAKIPIVGGFVSTAIRPDLAGNPQGKVSPVGNLALLEEYNARLRQVNSGYATQPLTTLPLFDLTREEFDAYVKATGSSFGNWGGDYWYNVASGAQPPNLDGSVGAFNQEMPQLITFVDARRKAQAQPVANSGAFTGMPQDTGILESWKEKVQQEAANLVPDQESIKQQLGLDDPKKRNMWIIGAVVAVIVIVGVYLYLKKG